MVSGGSQIGAIGESGFVMVADGKYFDYNATTPMSEVAREAWVETNERYWHNPSSLYREAGAAARLLEDLREELADRFDVNEPERIVFTSGATEANNAIIRHLARGENSRLGVSAVEHPCVDVAVKLEFSFARVREAKAVDDLRQWVRDGDVDAVSLMAANNETGEIFPWREVSEICRECGVTFHTDAAQWIGKMPLEGLGDCGFVTGSAHKFGGGKGAGFLVLPGGEEDFRGAVGGPQENGFRAGTENLPAIASMVAALREVGRGDPEGRDLFESRIEAEVIGADQPRLWNTSMFLLPHTKNLKWLTRLSARGFSVSTGSACSAGQGNPSRVMAEAGLDHDEMGRVIRASGGWETTCEDWTALADALAEVDAELRDQ